MDEQRSWQERWGVAGAEPEHVLVLVAIVLAVLAPFFALVRGEAGGIALGSALFLFFLGVLMAGAQEEHDEETKP